MVAALVGKHNVVAELHGIPQPTRPMQLSIAADLLIVLGCDLPQENARHSTRCVCESATVKKGEKIETGAADRTRTYDPIITNDVLYQLSYSGPASSVARTKVSA